MEIKCSRPDCFHMTFLDYATTCPASFCRFPHNLDETPEGSFPLRALEHEKRNTFSSPSECVCQFRMLLALQ